MLDLNPPPLRVRSPQKQTMIAVVVRKHQRVLNYYLSCRIHPRYLKVIGGLKNYPPPDVRRNPTPTFPALILRMMYYDTWKSDVPICIAESESWDDDTPVRQPSAEERYVEANKIK